ncbi:MAG TPA: hypothetical protein VNQ55_09485 [Parapedobacter sp.]|nr:hypothetical protein [Parapedobacter sp.]
MKSKIRTHLNDPAHLESLYRNNRVAFKQSFNDLLPTLKGNIVAECWNVRLNYADETIHWGSRKEFLFVLVAAAIACLIAQFPMLFSIDEEFFYPRNISFIIFSPLAVFFAWRHNLPMGKLAFLLGATLISVVFINLLPNNPESDTVVLSCLHLVLVLWSLLGFAFSGNTNPIHTPRIGFLTYNGDLLVLMALIAISGAILSGITIGLFAAIGLQIEDIYFQYVGITGAAAVPLVATFLIQSNPQLVGKISPVIARIFCPLVLAMLVVYLIAMAYGGKNPYTDRDFLLIFNVMLIGVMAIIFFSIAGPSPTKNRWETGIITLLAAVTVVVNIVALSAILFRIAEWGITPNRVAVLGANVLVLMNLIWVFVQLIRVVRADIPITRVQVVVARYLPIYCLWAFIVTFLFPMIFGI